MSENKNGHNTLEKTVFGFGLFFIILLVGYLVYELQQDKKKPPQLHVTSSFQPDMRFIAYKIKVENKGEETAEAANIQFDLYDNGKVVQSGTVGIDYVPPKSTETGWISFHGRTKRADSLVVATVTYIKP